jgi:transposase
LGRSKGVFTTQIHALTDALGKPLDFILTGGLRRSIVARLMCCCSSHRQALALYSVTRAMTAMRSSRLSRSKACKLLFCIANRIAPRDGDGFVYKERRLIECFFNKIKHYRRVFSRFEKLDRNYRGFIRFVSALIWLR